MIDNEIPDLVITDWMVPHMTGPELIAVMNARPELAHVPVVLLTAKMDQESRNIAIGQGAVGFLGKPFDHARGKPRLSGRGQERGRRSRLSYRI